MQIDDIKSEIEDLLCNINLELLDFSSACFIGKDKLKQLDKSEFDVIITDQYTYKYLRGGNKTKEVVVDEHPESRFTSIFDTPLLPVSLGKLEPDGRFHGNDYFCIGVNCLKEIM